MAHKMSNVSRMVSDTVDNVRDRIGARRRRNMLAEKWPLIALGAVLVAGLATGIAFAMVRRGHKDMDMNDRLDDMLGGGTTPESTV